MVLLATAVLLLVIVADFLVEQKTGKDSRIIEGATVIILLAELLLTLNR